ncbi:uncharacterized protein EI90DRAFT_3034967 [Cantharellus anzutake]|uniref:uncharacterized protein n=1 Tax=Cantharellus anzutake TaxID=1750568 RepID=UPI00190439FC|nr:uncharacterized protein EI90DRAFT_3034967 [Cantharellus anzutake]KAF8340270.1 hypothetical protein EI90DRAFT_3034967 [Cantharellus anzutake]
MTGARSNVTHRGHNQVVQCWLTSGTGTAPPNESRPQGMLSVRSTIEYDAAQQVEQVLGPQAPRKQPHRQLEWVEAPWDGRDTRTVGPWSFQGAV